MGCQLRCWGPALPLTAVNALGFRRKKHADERVLARSKYLFSGLGFRKSQEGGKLRGELGSCAYR